MSHSKPDFRPSEILSIEDLDKLTTAELAEYFLVMMPEVNAVMHPVHRDEFRSRDRAELLDSCRKLFKSRGIGSVWSRREEAAR